MSFYFFRLPSRQLFVLGVLGGGTAYSAYTAWDVVRSRRNAVPLFNSAAVVRTEESGRYPCERLHGFDVVVRSYYVSTSSKGERGNPSGGRTSTDTFANSLSRRWTRVVHLFSNTTHTVSGDSTTAGLRDGDAAVRVVARDARDAAAVARRTVGETTLIAASQWPTHTAKYSALVLEPSTNGTRESPPRSLLRQLADGATHQSLVRCNPRSTLLDMACEGDPAYLGAPYLRVLLSAFVLLPSTLSKLNVAVLGVGGGSLPLFLQEYFAGRLHRCDLVDVEPMCFKVAVEQLGLKEKLNTVALRQEGGGVQYYVEDAVQYLRRRALDGSGNGGSSSSGCDAAVSPLHLSEETPKVAVHASIPVFDGPAARSSPALLSSLPSISSKRQRQLDLLFVDLFVGSELDSAVTSVDFLKLCRGALSPSGVAAFNLPAADKAFVQRCGVVFGGDNVFRVPVPASSNEVVLVRGGVESQRGMVGPALSHRHFYRRAQELAAQYRLPYDLANHFPVWWRFW